MSRPILIICIDGLGPDYLKAAETPIIDSIAAAGTAVVARSVIPSVTNVNNVSIITGAPPSVHGLTANYWLDRSTGRETYMESPELLCAETVLQRAKKMGMSTCLLTSKKKLLDLLNAGADYALAAEEPSAEMVAAVGRPPDIYSCEINRWLFAALAQTLRARKPDLSYCATTDWAMHKYGPEDTESMGHVASIDSALGRILDENPHLEVYITADHGMSAKRRGVDLERVLAASGVSARAIPVI